MSDHKKNELVDYLQNRRTSYFMNEDYDRIKDGYITNSIKEYYDEKYLNKMINFFEQKEEYEKCNLLTKKLKYGL